MTFDAIIFDLDGTLIDSLDDIMAAGNHAMRTVGRPEHRREAGKKLAGQGLPYFIEHALGPDHQHLFDDAIAAHRTYYAEHCGEHSRPFDGIHDLLTALQAAGQSLNVLSNKPHFATVKDVQSFFSDFVFDQVIGHREGYPPKPDPTSAHEIREQLGVPADRIGYVGDTAADMLTGCAAGFFPVGVTWGFRDRDELEANGAKIIVDDVSALQDVLLRTVSA
ncbi:MAG: HAD family hydrolase [Planctomycetota bacterium]